MHSSYPMEEAEWTEGVIGDRATSRFLTGLSTRSGAEIENKIDIYYSEVQYKVILHEIHNTENATCLAPIYWIPTSNV